MTAQADIGLTDGTAAINALRDAFNKADRAKDAWKSKRDREWADRLNVLIRDLDQQLDAMYLADQRRLEEAAREARALLEEALVEHALAGKASPIPLGTIMVEWQNASYGRGIFKSGKRGVVEVFTNDSESPDNVRSWRRPAPGTIVIRLLKKDGSRSKVFERVGAHGWYPQEVTPSYA